MPRRTRENQRSAAAASGDPRLHAQLLRIADLAAARGEARAAVGDHLRRCITGRKTKLHSLLKDFAAKDAALTEAVRTIRRDAAMQN
jgi:hypothetical protein